MLEAHFFQDLALLMTVAGVVSVVFGKLRWPKVLGYIAAGVVMNGHTWGGSFLADPASVRTIGQLGVVFLMFTMGLGFSMGELKKLKDVTIPVAVVDTVVMTWLGYTVGRECFGWGAAASLFLGVAICDSATTMLAKVIGEMRWTDRPFVKYALGTSVCEDIVCVGMLALATGVAHGRGMSFAAVGLSLGGLLVFFLAVIVFGFVLVPRLLKSVAKTHDDEALALTILGCCFLVSWIAYKGDFSLALGAFLVGVVGAASDVRHRLVQLIDPLRSMFAAVFFVSIGLLVDPAACLAQGPAILLLTVLVLVGKTVNCTVAALLAGETVKTSVQLGMGLAQIGEFAFMVALLYVTVSGDMQCAMYDTVVAVSILTTLLNPLMLRASEPVGAWIEARLPEGLARRLEAYRAAVGKLRASHVAVGLRREIRRDCRILGIIAVLEIAVAGVVTFLIGHDWSGVSRSLHDWRRLVFGPLFILFCAAAAAPVWKVGRSLAEKIARVLVGEDGEKWRLTLRAGITQIVALSVFALFGALSVMCGVNLMPPEPWARAILGGVLVLVAVGGSSSFLHAAHRAVVRFDEALGAEERQRRLGEVLTLALPEGTAHHRLPLGADSPAIGETVVSLDLRAKTGATVLAIERGGVRLSEAPVEVEFRSGDVLTAVGGGRQIAALKDLLGITAEKEEGT